MDFVCVDVLRLSQQYFSYVGTFPVILGSPSIKQRTKCFAQGHDIVHPVCLELVTRRSQVYHSTK